MNKQDRVDEAFSQIQGQRWSGAGRDVRIEKLIREVQQMKQATGKRFSVGMLVAVGIAGVVGGGAIAGVVTHQVMSWKGTIVAEDGTAYDVILSPTTEGAAGSFVTDDGTVYGVDMVEDGNTKTVNFEADGLEPGESATFTLEGTPEIETEESDSDG